MTHFKKVCKECSRIVSQCRCMDPNKTVIEVVCEDCRRKKADEALDDAARWLGGRLEVIAEAVDSFSWVEDDRGGHQRRYIGKKRQKAIQAAERVLREKGLLREVSR